MKHLIRSPWGGLVVFSALLAITATLFSLWPSRALAVQAGLAGTYMLVRQSDSVMFAIDTTTGRVWHKGDAESKWTKGPDLP